MAKRQRGRGSSQDSSDPLDRFSREEEELMQLRAQAGADQDNAARKAEQQRWATPAQGNSNYDAEDKRGMYEDAVAPGQEYGHVSAGAHGGAPEPEDLKKREDAGEENAEDGGKATGKQKSKDDEGAKVDDIVGKGYTGSADGGDDKKSRFSMTKKKGAGIIVGIILGSLSAAGFSTLHGPFEFIHASAWLQKIHFSISNNTSDTRAGRLFKYARTRNDPNRRNLGWKGNLIADYYERKMTRAGIIVDYFKSDGTKSGSVQRFKVDPNTKDGQAALKKIEALDIDPARISTGADGVIEFDVSNGGSKDSTATRKILKGTVDAMGFNKVSNSLANRVLRFRAGVSFHQLRNRVLDKGADLVGFIRGVRAEREKIITEGVTESDLNKPVTGQDPAQDATPEEQAAAAQADNAANDLNEFTDTSALPAGEAGIKELADNLKGKLTKGLAGVAVVAFMCAVKSFGDSFGPFMKANIIEPMIRTSMMTISIGNQIMSPVGNKKDVSAQELGVYSKSFFDDAKKLGWTSGASVQAAMGHAPTGPDLPSSMKPGRDKPAFFRFLDGITGLGTACGAISSKVGSIALNAASLVAGGPVAFIVDYVTGIAVGKAADSLHLFENLARLIFKGGVSTDAAGPLFGNIINYGARLADNDAQIAKGGSELSNSQVITLENENRQWLAAEESQKSVYARYLDPKNIDSLTGAAIMNMPRSPTQAIAAFIRAPLQSIGAMFRPAGAQGSNQNLYDYGFAKYGFSLEDQENPIVDNPYENADAVEPRLAELNQKYGSCFSTTVDPATGSIVTKEVVIYKDIPDMCHDGSNEELLRYRFYLLDQFTANAMACYAGEEDSCDNMRGNNAPAPTPTPGGGSPGTGAGGGMIVGDPYTDGTSVPCAIGTTFNRVDTGYVNGTPFPINLCSLPNLFEYDTPALVNSRVSGAWLALVNAANAAGFQLSAVSSYRTMAEQEAIFARNGGDSTVAATPGYSSHQAGVAIDFADMSAGIAGQTCDTRATSSNPAWQWLVDNAGKFGFHQYSAEAWHWDAYPSSNRC